MKRTKRVFSSAFKAEVALAAIKGVKTVSELAQEYEAYMREEGKSQNTIGIYLRGPAGLEPATT